MNVFFHFFDYYWLIWYFVNLHKTLEFLGFYIRESFRIFNFFILICHVMNYLIFFICYTLLIELTNARHRGFIALPALYCLLILLELRMFPVNNCFIKNS